MQPVNEYKVMKYGVYVSTVYFPANLTDQEVEILLVDQGYENIMVERVN